jgi:type IV pilus assembly protein PilM
MASIVTGIDVGTRAVRVVQGKRKGTAFVPTRYVVRARLEGESAADALTQCLTESRIKGSRARLGITGRDTILRYSQVPRLSDSQLRNLMRFEIDELAQQAGGNLASDFNLLPIPPGMTGDDTVLVALARNDTLDSTVGALRGTGAGIGSFTPNAVALYDSFLKLGSVAEDGVLIANVGDENTDVAIVLGPDLAFARNLSGGGRLFTDAIRQRFGVDDEQAEEMKRTLANLSPNAKGRYTSPQEEKVTNAMLGPAGQFASLLQSTAALAKAQLKLPELKIQRALLCGGGSRLLGFGEYLAATTGWQVQLFDPLESMELGSLPTEERAELERDRFEAVVALGLALASAETGLYRLDILPEAIVRKRRFLERTSFVIAAVVLAAGYLGAEAYFTSALATDARTTANAVSREVKQRQAVNDKTLEILGDPNNGVPGRNAELAEIATELEVRAAAGASLLAVDRALRNLLPSDLWITKEIMKIDRDAARPDLGAKDLPRPIVHLIGKGREGAEKIEQTFPNFTARLTEALGVAPVQMFKKGSTGFEFELFIDLVPVASAAAAKPN